MGVYKDKYKTKDGKQWFFKIRYTDIDGSPAQKKSGRFATKKEACINSTLNNKVIASFWIFC